MEKEQYGSVIRFLFLEGKSRSEIKQRLDAVYGDSSPSMATVKNWLNEFQRGRTSVFDELRPGAPKPATTENNVIKTISYGKTITGLYYAGLLGRFDADLEKKRPHLAKKKVLFHHDNEPAHTSAVATAKLVESGYELLTHPPYSPDLATCDFFLFSNLKKSLAGQKFESNEVIAATEAYFADLQKTYFLDGLKKLEHRWVKGIELKGDYVEK